MLHEGGGGGATYLGLANDDITVDSVLGVCDTYCFSSTPQYGLWAESTQLGDTPNVVEIDSAIYMLIPGSYTSLESLDALVGCPVNGPWTLSIIDYWAIDNGFLCGWSVTPQDDAFIGEGPLLGTAHPDSSIWSGPGVVVNVGTPTMATAPTVTTGPQTFNYFVQDSYGCSYDTTFTVHVLGNITAYAGVDTALCDGPLLAAATINTSDGPIGCDYTLILRDTVHTGWSRYVRVVTDLGARNYWLPYPVQERTIPLQLLGTSNIALYYLAESPQYNAGNQVFLINEVGDTLVHVTAAPSSLLYSAAVPCYMPGVSIAWSPAETVSPPGSLNPWMHPIQNTNYTMEVTVAGNAGCTSSDQVYVAASQYPPLTLSYDPDLEAVCTVDASFFSYAWENLQQGQTTTNTGPCVPVPALNLDHARTLIATDAQGCLAFSDTIINCPVATFFYSPNVDQHLAVNSGHPPYTWTRNGTLLSSVTTNYIALAQYGPGVYEVTFTTNYGCTVTGTYNHMVTGTGEVQADDSGLQVYPSPNTGTFQVVLPQDRTRYNEVRVLDAAGRTVHTQPIGSESAANMITVYCAVASGAYVLELQGPGSRIRQRIVMHR